MNSKQGYRRVQELLAKQSAGKELTQAEKNIIACSSHGTAAGCRCKK